LYFDISESIKISDENSSFFWVPEDLSEEDIIEAKATGLKIIPYPLENLLKEITYMEKAKPKKDLGKGITISLKNEEIPLDQQVVENCAEHFEILHDEIEKTPGLDIGPFFEGEEVNWRELAANCDVCRSQIEESRLEDKIGKEMNKDAPNKGFLLLAEYAGSGTTTIMKRLGFNIAKKRICPVVYLYRLDSNTWKLLEEFYQSCGNRKFLILIDNVSPQSDKFRELYGMLQSRRVNSVFLATARRDEWNQVMISYIQNSGEDIDVEEGGQSKIKRFKWITLKTVDDILNQKEKDLLLRNFVDFGVLTKKAASRFGKGYSNETLKYSNLLPLCWAATEGKNRKFELIVKEYYADKIKLSEQRIVDVVCAVNLFYSKGITDRMVHRILNVTWDRLKLLLNSDSMQQLIMIKPDYYDGKQVHRVIPRNHGISEILLQPEASEFPQRVLTILTDNLLIEEGEGVEEDILFNIVRNKELHKYLADKSNKNKLFEFAHEQLPYDSRILQHWGIMLYEHAREQAKFGNLEDPAWEESIDKLNQASKGEPYNAVIYHSLGMANMVRAGLFWEKYQRNRMDKSSYQVANLYYRDAIDYFEKALDLNPHEEYAYNTIIRILLDRLVDLKRKGPTEEFENLMAEVHGLLEECDHMVPVDKQVMLQEMKTRWYNVRGDISKAKSQYRGLLEKNPKNHSVSYLLAALLMDDKTISSLGEAEDVIERALAEGKRSKGFYKLRYRIAERLYPFDYPKLETLLKGIVCCCLFQKWKLLLVGSIL
jgi:tetratricopeptide (TPR) repeat protein